MKKERKPRISLCMIVKNEEAKLERALSWGQGILWEKVVVDTGSTDGTVELAKRFGATVYHFDWIDDFAAARNFAQKQAKGDWILTLDADEYPAPGTPEKLFDVVSRAEERGADGVFGEILELNSAGNVMACSFRIRLFRNCPEIRYRRRIHEQLEFTDGSKLTALDGKEDVSFFHDGYAEQGLAEEQRTNRNLCLLEQELSEHPDDYEIMGYLGDEYRSFGETEKAADWYRKSLEHLPKILPASDPRTAWTCSSLISIYTSKKEYEEAEKVYQRAVRLQPKEADYDYEMGRLAVAMERWEEGLCYLGNGLSKLEKGPANSCVRIRGALEEVYGNLALCFLRLGRRKEAVETAVALLKVKPYEMKALYILLSAFQEDGGERAEEAAYVENVAAFLGNLYSFSELKDRLFIARAAKEAGWEAMRSKVEVER
ncbi:MAG: glycosyltransferase [Lachnospiraceae bacterium]|jgi:pentatricopeptide repeat protein|nr:glycosyltransferase [Lachnospiraceae bacterium]